MMMPTVLRFSALLVVSLVLDLSAAAAGIEIAPRAIRPTSFHDGGAQIAVAGDRVMVVWQEEMGEVTGFALERALLDGEGRAISSRAALLTEMDVAPRWWQLIGAGDRFLLLFQPMYPGSARPLLRELALDGSLIRTRVLDLPPAYRAVAQWNDGQILVALETTYGDPLRRSRAETFLLDDHGDVVRIGVGADVTPLRVVAAGDGFLVVSLANGLTARLIAGDGSTVWSVLVDRPGEDLLSPRGPVAAEWRDDSAIVVWPCAPLRGSFGELRAARIDANGVRGTIHTVVPPQREVPMPLHVTRRFGSPLLVYLDGGRVRSMHLDASGAAASAGSEGPPSRTLAAAVDAATIIVAGDLEGSWEPRTGSVTVAPDGQFGDLQALTLIPVAQTRPVLTHAGNHVLAAWTESEGDASFVRSALLDRNGVPSEAITVAPGYLTATELPCNETACLAVIWQPDRLLATRVDLTGAPIDAVPIALSATRVFSHLQGPHVAWTGHAWVVIWNDFIDGPSVVFVSPAGVATERAPLEVPRLADVSFRVRGLASNGTRTLLVWGEWVDDHSIVRAMFLPTGGEPGTAFELPLDPDVERYVVGASGNAFLVADPSRMIAVSLEGGAPQILATREIRGAGDIAWDGREWVVVGRRFLGQWTLDLQRFDAMLQPVGERRYTTTGRTIWHEQPSVVARSGEAAWIAMSEGDPESGLAAMLVRENELDALPELPPPPSNVRFVLVGEGWWKLSWDPPPYGTVEMYVVERIEDGVTHIVAWVDGDQHELLLTGLNGDSGLRVRSGNARGVSEPVRVEPPARRRAATIR